MATQDLGKTESLPAYGDLSAAQFHFVSIRGDGRIQRCGAGAAPDGVLQNKPAATDRAGCVMKGPGRTKVVAGAATTLGAYGASDANGHAVDAVTGDHIAGKFMEAATAAGDVVSFNFLPHAAVLD